MVSVSRRLTDVRDEQVGFVKTIFLCKKLAAEVLREMQLVG